MLQKYKFITTEDQIYFIFAESYEEAQQKWAEQYGRALTAKTVQEQK